MLVTRALDLALRAVFAHQRRRARECGARATRAGAITFVQRFGGALNLNVHFHCLVPDGVFARENGQVRFVALAPLSDEDVRKVLHRVVVRVVRLLRPRLSSAQQEDRPLDALGATQVEAMSSPGAAAARHRAGQKARRLPRGLFAPRRGAPARQRPGGARTPVWLRRPASSVAGPALRAARWTARLSAQAAPSRRPLDVVAAAHRVAAAPGHAGSAAARAPHPVPRRVRARIALAWRSHPADVRDIDHNRALRRLAAATRGGCTRGHRAQRAPSEGRGAATACGLIPHSLGRIALARLPRGRAHLSLRRPARRARLRRLAPAGEGDSQSPGVTVHGPTGLPGPPGRGMGRRLGRRRCRASATGALKRRRSAPVPRLEFRLRASSAAGPRGRHSRNSGDPGDRGVDRMAVIRPIFSIYT